MVRGHYLKAVLLAPPTSRAGGSTPPPDLGRSRERRRSESLPLGRPRPVHSRRGRHDHHRRRQNTGPPPTSAPSRGTSSPRLPRCASKPTTRTATASSTADSGAKPPPSAERETDDVKLKIAWRPGDGAEEPRQSRWASGC